PPGATRRAFDREDNGGVTPGSPLGDPHAAGTPGGGTETGGLAGSNVGDGSPLAEGEDVGQEGLDENGPRHAGPSGGAAGGDTAVGAGPAARRGKGTRKR